MSYKIGFVGVPGTGKTRTARGLASILADYNVELVSEYAREYIAKHGVITNVAEQYLILHKQLALEEKVDYAKIVITDSPIHLGFYYASMLKRSDSKDRAVYTTLFKEITALMPRYDVIFHIPPVTEPLDDGIREEKYLTDISWRAKADCFLKHSLNQLFPSKRHFVIPEQLVETSERVEFCVELMRKMKMLETNQKVVMEQT